MPSKKLKLKTFKSKNVRQNVPLMTFVPFFPIKEMKLCYNPITEPFAEEPFKSNKLTNPINPINSINQISPINQVNLISPFKSKSTEPDNLENIKKNCLELGCKCVTNSKLKCDHSCSHGCCKNENIHTNEINDQTYIRKLESVIITILYYDPYLRESIISSALLNGFQVDESGDMTIIVSSYEPNDLYKWVLQYEYNLNISIIYGSYYYQPWNKVKFTHHSKINISHTSKQQNSESGTTSTSYFPTQITKIYGFPKPTKDIVIGVIGLVGVVNTTEIATYWSSYCGIPTNSLPKVVIIATDGTSINPNVVDYDLENTMDIELIGGCCANTSCKVTIILYHAENTVKGLYTAFNYAINDTVNNPIALSCSWGISEVMYTNSGLAGINQMKAFDTLFQKAVQKGINICCASGDYAAGDGINDGFPHVDFPASSPNIVSCGGTTLFAPDFIYDIKTVETVWSFDVNYNTGTGAGTSAVFTKPTYQNNVLTQTVTKRGVCDISSNSDPNTGYKILFNGQIYIMGGTSCSAPVIASFIALCGIKKFINPLIYNNPGVFNKISSGSNGYYSADSTGKYSLCSGLGSPSSLLAQLLSQ